MFKTIQVLKDSYLVRLSPNGHIGTGQPKGRTALTVMRKRGHTVQLPFGGFIYTTNTEGLKLLKAVDITALCTDDEATYVAYEIPRGHYVVGVYVDGRVFILVRGDEIIHDMWRLNEPRNNVAYIKNHFR